MSISLIFPATQEPIYLLEDANQVIWFKAADVCRILGFSNPSDAIQNHCPDASKEIDYQDGRGRAALFVSEFGLYTLVMVSKKETGCEFRRWLAYDVLPSLRRTGAYGTTIAQQEQTKEAFSPLGFLDKLQNAQESLVDQLNDALASSPSHEQLNAIAASMEAVRKAKSDFQDRSTKSAKTALAKSDQTERWDEAIAKYLETRPEERIKTRELIAAVFDLDLSKVSRSQEMEAASSLKRLGYQRSTTHGGRRYWKKSNQQRL